MSVLNLPWSARCLLSFDFFLASQNYIHVQMFTLKHLPIPIHPLYYPLTPFLSEHEARFQVIVHFVLFMRI